MAITGSCLCGDVRFEVHGKISPIGHCHCSKCRKVSGAGSNAVFWAKPDGVRFVSGEDRIAEFRFEDGWTSSFCQRCGSPTPHANAEGTTWFVPAGLLDDDPGVRQAVHIHVDSAAPWEEIHGALPRYREGLDSPRIDTDGADES